jgi:predicted dithiol-disulfide oxidoreductase (DUF899 family)
VTAQFLNYAVSEEADPTDQREEHMTDHTIGTRDEWLAAREELLKREKEATRSRGSAATSRG